MRIGFDASVASGQPGGTGTYAAQLLNALICQRPDWSFVLYFRRADQPNPLLTLPEGATNVERITVPGSPNSWRVQVALPRRLRQDRIDVYHSPGPFLPVRWHGPKVVTIHDLNIYLNVRNWLRPKTFLAWADLALQTPFSAWVARRVIMDSLLKLPGYVPRSTLRGLYAGALCLVLPSHGEGFGLPVVEAMALGAPILAANRQAIPEVVGEGGLLFDPTDSAELSTLL